ncbi:LruC domain-containing protein [Flammeovirga pectinis]|uniref:LruC domain-containing protein n=1 Tax=Flammeovirga pectinis TaxID=2494373 RepID=A0A3S9P6N4_9BACT|nr:LruC domain-containing protein [Flammeovirga pectinis]AZQ63764.1 LruC domain-containing protein [Flammeovirga pectinis]
MRNFLLTKISLAIFLITLSLGCSSTSDDSPGPTTNTKDGGTLLYIDNTSEFEKIDIPDGFNYEMTSEVTFTTSRKNGVGKIVYAFYTIDYNNTHTFIGKALSNTDGVLEYKVNIAGYIEKIYVTMRYRGTLYSKTIAKNSTNLQIIFDENSTQVESSNTRTKACNDVIYAVNNSGQAFTINIGNNTVDNVTSLAEGGSKASAVNAAGDKLYYDINGSIYTMDMSNVNGNGTLVDNSGAPLSPPNLNSNQYTGLEYIADQNILIAYKNKELYILSPSNYSIVRKPTMSGFNGSDTGIDGDVAIDIAGNYFLATNYGLYSINFASDYSTAALTLITNSSFPYTITGIGFDSDNILYASTDDIPSKLITIDTQTGVHNVVFTLPGNIDDFSISRCDIVSIDTDGDGVADIDDTYPNDINKAFNNFAPAENVNSYLAYEDLYPNKGDFDFNDIIVEYNANLITNGNNEITFIKFKFKVKSVGAANPSGFAIELPVEAAKIKSVTGMSITAPGTINLETNGVESGIPANKTVFAVFDNSFNILSQSGNVKASSLINITVEFKTPVAYASLNQVPYNPFIFTQGDRANEVHLPGKQYTVKFNTDLLSAGQDAGNYKTAQGHPWALHIPVEFAPPKEEVDITTAYKRFNSFITSNGSQDIGWYTNQSGNRDDEKLAY